MRDPFARAPKIKSAQAMPGTSAVLALLAELVAEVRGLRADLAAGRSAPDASNEAIENPLREIEG